MSSISFLITFIFLLYFSPLSFASPATVVLLKGTVLKLSPGDKNPKPVQTNEKIMEGTTISTKDKSFARLLLADQSQINVGPNSSMQIEKTKANEPGMIELIDGKIRAKITKDLLQKEGDDKKNKLLIHTKVAAMGVRGTDFQVTYSSENQSVSLITFESSVAMVKLDQPIPPSISASESLSKLTENLSSDKAVLVSEGQFSSARAAQDSASAVVRISPDQVEALKKNETMITSTAEQGLSTDKYISPIPPGVDSKNFVATAGIERSLEAVLGKEIAGKVLAEANNEISARSEKNQPNDTAVIEGGYVDLNKNIYIAPDPSKGAIFDATLNMYIPDPSIQIGANGELQLKEGVFITESGEVLQLEPGALPPQPGQNAGDLRGPASELGLPGASPEENLNDQDEEDDETEEDDDTPTTSPTTTDVQFNISA